MYARWVHAVPAASEDVRGACLRDRVVVLIAVDTGRFARFAVGRDGQRVAVGAQRDDVPELRAHLGIRRLDVGLLRPSFALPHEDIHRAGAVHRVVVLVAVEPLRAATLVRRSDRHGVPVAADGHAPSSMTVEHAAAPEMVLDLWIRRLEIGDLLQLSGADRSGRWGSLSPGHQRNAGNHHEHRARDGTQLDGHLASRLLDVRAHVRPMEPRESVTRASGLSNRFSNKSSGKSSHCRA